MSCRMLKKMLKLKYNDKWYCSNVKIFICVILCNFFIIRYTEQQKEEFEIET